MVVGPRTEAGKRLAEWLDMARRKTGFSGIPTAAAIVAIEDEGFRQGQDGIEAGWRDREAWSADVRARHAERARWVEFYIAEFCTPDRFWECGDYFCREARARLRRFLDGLPGPQEPGVPKGGVK